MADAEGPGNHRPNVCNTLTFADLGDIRGFSEPGGLQVYGLELTESGYYRRAPVVVPASPSWDLKLEIKRPYAYFKDGEVVRIENQGKMLAVFVRTSKGSVEVDGSGRFYILKATKAAKNAKLEAHTEFPGDSEYLKKPPAALTIWLEVVLGKSPKEWVDVLTGLSIKWTTPKIVAFIIRNSGGTFKVSATAPAPEDKIKSGAIGLGEIPFSLHVGFIRLLVSLTEISDEYIADLAGKLDNLQPPISSG